MGFAAAKIDVLALSVAYQIRYVGIIHTDMSRLRAAFKT
jgi:hypothetical protein